MSLRDLAPISTKRARESAARSFKKFLADEGVTWEYLAVCMTRENAPLVLEAVMDKFGMFLAFKEGRKGQLLARHSVMQYYRQAKNWVVDQFPHVRQATDKVLLKKGQVLERYCMKRESGTFVNKAPACTKKSLKMMVQHLYSTALTASDYQDAALLCLLWFLFGRASDLTLLRKVNLSVGSGNIFFVRFIRIKTSEEQGLSLFPDDDFTTCPLLAIALALVTQSAPTASLLNQLPVQHGNLQATLTPTAPLIDLIDHPEDVTPLQKSEDTEEDRNLGDDAPGIHSYVNRVLRRVARQTDVTERLTSHSFRRGGAQHANGAGMCAQWIFDRGAWNMTATSKAFAYVFNTPAEDHKIARVLSNRDPNVNVPLLSLDAFDSDTQQKVISVASALFVASSGLDTPQYNVNARVINTLMAYLLRHYPALKSLSAHGPAIQRLEACAIEKGFSVNDLLAWSSHLTCDTDTPEKENPSTPQETSTDITKHPVFLHQSALIEQLIQVNKTLDARLTVMENKLCNKHTRTPALHKVSEDTSINNESTKRRRTSPASSLKDTWFAWYAQEPRMWSSTDGATKHIRSNAKWLVAFMKLFLVDGFILDTASASYRDQVLALGVQAEKSVLTFLDEHSISSRGSGAVLKHLRTLHRAGELNSRIERHEQLFQTPAIQDPAPGYTQNILEKIRV